MLKSRSFWTGFGIAILWGVSTGASEFRQCHPSWSGMCGFGFAMVNFPGAAVLSALQVPTGNAIVAMLLVTLINGLLLGMLFYAILSIGKSFVKATTKKR